MGFVVRYAKEALFVEKGKGPWWRNIIKIKF
jgi:hypothetical protein